MGGASELRAIIDRQKTPAQKRADTAFGSGAVSRSRGGGGGSSSSSSSSRRAAEAAAAAEAARKENLRKQAEAEQARQEEIKAEQARQIALRNKLLSNNAQMTERTLRDSKTGDQIRQQVLINNRTNERILTNTNLNTGEQTIRTFERQRNKSGGLISGRTFETGGLTQNVKQQKQNINQIKTELTLSGLKPILTNGQVTGFMGSNLKKYPYTEKGIKEFNKDMSSKDMSIAEKPAKYTPFISEFQNLAEALDKSKKGSKVKEVIKVPLKIFSNFVPGVWNNLKSIPPSIAFLATNPKEIKNIPRNFIEGTKQDITLLKTKPSNGIAKVGSDYFTFKLISGGLGITGKVAKTNYIKLNPFLKKFDNAGKLIIRKAPLEVFKIKGKTRFLKSRVQKPSIKRPFSSVSDFLKGRKPGQFKKFTRDPGLILKKQTVKTGAKSLAEQTKFAGREVTAVNAAADQLTSWIRRKKIIRKPIPGEADFPRKIKNILQKFDEGKNLTNKEFADANIWLQKNVAPNITLLERSLYLDPTSGLRISRLGIQQAKNATFKDILRGNFRLWNKSGKPQILVFENAMVAKFPKSLKDIVNKLKKGKPLSASETNRLIRWQVKTGSGEFKPIGSTIYAGGRELEVTLAPGEFIKRIKKIGTTYVDGKRVKIVSAEIFKPSKSLLRQIKLANLGKLSIKKLKELEKTLSKKLGRKIKIETPSSYNKILKRSEKIARRADANIPVLRIRGSRLIIIRRRISKRTITKRTNTKRTPTKRTPTKRTPTKRTPTKRIPTKRTTTKRIPTKRTTTKRTPTKRTTTKRTPTKRTRTKIIPRPRTPKKQKKPQIIIRIPENFKKKTIRKAQPVYYVKEKVRGKLINLTPRPLTLRDAKDFLAYRLDNRLSRSGFFEPLGKTKNIVRPPKKIQGYFGKTSRKYRAYRIKVGKKKAIRNGYIEKTKYNLDTKGEKMQIKKTRKNKPKRKMTSSKRKVMLNNLKKARMVRMKNLKKKK